MGWQLHENELPGWASVVKKVILVQPSSAASERFVFPFSLLQNSFDEKQQNCLEEHPLCYTLKIILFFKNSLRIIGILLGE